MEASAYRQLAAIEGRHWWHVGRRDILRTLLTRYAAPRPRRIVEIGCGTGGNLPLLGEFGAVAGVEDSANAIAGMGEGLRQLVQPGSLPDRIPFAPATFDWVCLFDVLEHVDDEVAALRRCRELLAPGGSLLITVPAYQWLWGPHDVEQHHRRRYTRARLLSAAAAAGLVPRYATYFNTWLLPLAIAGRLRDRFGGGSATGLGVPPAWLNDLLRRLFASERHVLTRASLPCGLSIFAVLEAAPAP